MKQIPSNLVQLILQTFIKLPIPIREQLSQIVLARVLNKNLRLSNRLNFDLGCKQISSKRKAKEKA